MAGAQDDAAAESEPGAFRGCLPLMDPTRRTYRPWELIHHSLSGTTSVGTGRPCLDCLTGFLRIVGDGAPISRAELVAEGRRLVGYDSEYRFERVGMTERDGVTAAEFSCVLTGRRVRLTTTMPAYSGLVMRSIKEAGGSGRLEDSAREMVFATGAAVLMERVRQFAMAAGGRLAEATGVYSCHTRRPDLEARFSSAPEGTGPDGPFVAHAFGDTSPTSIAITAGDAGTDRLMWQEAGLTALAERAGCVVTEAGVVLPPGAEYSEAKARAFAIGAACTETMTLNVLLRNLVLSLGGRRFGPWLSAKRIVAAHPAMRRIGGMVRSRLIDGARSADGIIGGVGRSVRKAALFLSPVVSIARSRTRVSDGLRGRVDALMPACEAFQNVFRPMMAFAGCPDVEPVRVSRVPPTETRASGLLAVCAQLDERAASAAVDAVRSFAGERFIRMVPKPASLRAPGAPVGLANLGNTCYLNAAVQSLFHAPQVRDRVLAARFDADADAARAFLADAHASGASQRVQAHARRYLRAVDFLCELQHLFGLLAGSDRAAVEATQLLEAFAAHKGGEGAANPHLWRNFAAAERSDAADQRLAAGVTAAMEEEYRAELAAVVADGSEVDDTVRATAREQAVASADELLTKRMQRAYQEDVPSPGFQALAFFAQADADEWRESVLAMADDVAMGFQPSPDGRAFSGVPHDVAKSTPRVFPVRERILAGLNSLRGVLSSVAQQVEVLPGGEEAPLGEPQPVPAVRLPIVRGEVCTAADGSIITDPMVDLQCRQSSEFAARNRVTVVATPVAPGFVSPATAATASAAVEAPGDAPWPLTPAFGLHAPGQVSVYSCLAARLEPGGGGLPPSQRTRLEVAAPVLSLSLERTTAWELSTSVHVPLELYLDEFTHAEGPTDGPEWEEVRRRQAALARAEAVACEQALSRVGLSHLSAADIEEGWRCRVSRLDRALATAAAQSAPSAGLSEAERDQLRRQVELGEAAFDSPADLARAIQRLEAGPADTEDAASALQRELAELATQRDEVCRAFAAVDWGPADGAVSGEGSAGASDGAVSGEGSAGASDGAVSGEGSAGASDGAVPGEGSAGASDGAASGEGSAGASDGAVSGEGSAGASDGAASGESLSYAAGASAAAGSGPGSGPGSCDDALGHCPRVQRLRAAVAEAYAAASGVRYRLVSATVHMGPSAEGGHYVCFCPGDDTGMWWRLDDDQARQVDLASMLEEVQSGSGTRRASTLLYERLAAERSGLALARGGSAGADTLASQGQSTAGGEPKPAAAALVVAATEPHAPPAASLVASSSSEHPDVSLVASPWRRDIEAERAGGLEGGGTRWWDGLEPAASTARSAPAAALAGAVLPSHVAAIVRADNDDVRNAQGLGAAQQAGERLGSVLCELLRLAGCARALPRPATLVTWTGLTRAEAERWARDELAALRRGTSLRPALHAAEQVVDSFTILTGAEPEFARPLSPGEVAAGWGSGGSPFSHGLADVASDGVLVAEGSPFAAWDAALAAADGSAALAPCFASPPWAPLRGVPALLDALGLQIDAGPAFGPVAVPTQSRFRCMPASKKASGSGDRESMVETTRLPPGQLADISVLDAPGGPMEQALAFEARNQPARFADGSTGPAASLPDVVRGVEGRRAVAASVEVRATLEARAAVRAAAAEPAARLSAMLARLSAGAGAAEARPCSLPGAGNAAPGGAEKAPPGSGCGVAAASAEPCPAPLDAVLRLPGAEEAVFGDTWLPQAEEDEGRQFGNIPRAVAPGCLGLALPAVAPATAARVEREFVVPMGLDAFTRAFSKQLLDGSEGAWLVADEAAALHLDSARVLPSEWILPDKQWQENEGRSLEEAVGRGVVTQAGKVSSRLHTRRVVVLSPAEVSALARCDEFAFHPLVDGRASHTSRFAEARRIGLPRGTVAELLSREMGATLGDLPGRHYLQVNLKQAYAMGHSKRAPMSPPKGQRAVVMLPRAAGGAARM